MQYVAYGIYNIAYLAISAVFYLYANTYLNIRIIPNSLRWRDGHVRQDLTGQAIAQSVVLLVEVAILAYLLWVLNKWFLSTVIKSESALSIATWSVVTYSVLSIVAIGIIVYASFK